MLFYAFANPGTLAVVPFLMALTGPLAALVAWLISCKAVWSQPVQRRRTPWRAGLIVGMMAVVATEWSMVSLRGDIDKAIKAQSKHDGSHARSLAGLRTNSRETFLLNLCYNESHAGAFGPMSHMLFRSSFSREDLRSLYFRVTGIPFSDAPPPRGVRQSLAGTRISRDETLDGFAWDEDRGGAETGARIRGLSMQSSRMDWHVDADSALAHGEWTLEFHNQHRNAQEARCQMLLPPGACVSRLTLWINGEPREAAFGARSQVTEAYRQTVSQNRDPVLVNMAGPDRVLTQCFPVPSNGRMKIRLGITAPLDAQAPAALFMPLIVERNFSIPDGTTQTIWVQSPQALEVLQEWRSAAMSKDGAWTWQAEVTQAKLANLSFGVKQPPLPKVWTKDKLAGDEPPVVIVERTQAAPPTDGTAVFVVVDASSTLRPHAAIIREALKQLAKKAPVTVWASTDGEAVEIPVAEIDARLQNSAFAGGRDAVPPFKAALKRLRETTAPATLIWLHGPQAAKISGAESIKQLFERGAARPVIHALELEHGRNTFLEEMYDSAPIVSGLRWQEGGGANALFETLMQIHHGPATVAKTTRAATPPADGREVWDQLARHVVFREVMAVFQGRDHVPETQAKRAAQHQLVTPYSGAVVLDNQAQYDRAGLKPVDSGSAPQIPTLGTPEPSRMLLIMLGMSALCLRRRRGLSLR
ncbi:VIT domain-containing protein [Prosthecobacter sp.]|uniref:VIT domain-containing protein n=1 Tax=Prosthecobacter sp. TaxID=1965333 RepID=UPI00378370D3